MWGPGLAESNAVTFFAVPPVSWLPEDKTTRKATTGYWYVFRLSVQIASFLVWWLSMILRTYLQNFSSGNSFKWEIWPKNLKKSLFCHIHTPTSLLKLQK